MDNRITRHGPVMGSNSPVVTRSKQDESLVDSIIEVSNTSSLVDKSIGDQGKEIQQLEKAIRAVQGPEKSFEISMHQQTHTIMIKVFDKQSGDLIREIPQEKLLDMVANMMELNGLIVDKKV